MLAFFLEKVVHGNIREPHASTPKCRAVVSMAPSKRGVENFTNSAQTSTLKALSLTHKHIRLFRTKENNDDDSISLSSSSQRSDGYSTPSSASISMEDIDENFLPDLYDFEESLAVKCNNDEDIELKFGPVKDFDVADSMDTIVNNVDSRSAMALD